MSFKSGFVTIVGRTNVGKSTLLNKIIGQKIVITSDKPQTTRQRLKGVYTNEEGQIVFIDTPGIHKPQHKLGDYMVKAALTTLKDVDLVLFVVDVTEKRSTGDDHILELLRNAKLPVILVLNKIDLLKSQAEILHIIEDYSKEFPFTAVVPLSALQDKELEVLVQEIEKNLPVGPHYFDEDVLTDQAERVIAGEMIREKIKVNPRFRII